MSLQYYFLSYATFWSCTYNCIWHLFPYYLQYSIVSRSYIFYIHICVKVCKKTIRTTCRPLIDAPLIWVCVHLCACRLAFHKEDQMFQEVIGFEGIYSWNIHACTFMLHEVWEYLYLCRRIVSRRLSTPEFGCCPLTLSSFPSQFLFYGTTGVWHTSSWNSSWFLPLHGY